MINQFRYSAGKFSCQFYQLTLSGSDVVSFLQAQSTFDIKILGKNKFHLVSFLDPQGRIETYVWLLNSGNVFQVLIPMELLDQTLERLNRYLISEDVNLSDPSLETWHFLLGHDALSTNHSDSFQGDMFADSAILSRKDFDAPTISNIDLEIWRGLSGWPTLNGEGFQKEIINNSRLFDLSVSFNKGCYPGQETVSKIATRRGAAYNEVLIELAEPVPLGEMTIETNKIGIAHAIIPWEEKWYLACKLLRDFRVDGLQINFKIAEKSINGRIRYYPLLKGDPVSKALELYFLALEFFKRDDYSEAEKNFRFAIKINPEFADAYEGLGVLLGRMERFGEAVEVMKQLSLIDPDSVLAHTNMSLFLMRLGKIEEAENEKSQATLKSFKKFGEEARAKEAAQKATDHELSEWAKRESMFMQVLEIDPEDALANFGLGSIAVEKRDWKKALNYLEKVIASDPKYSVAYLALGKTLSSLGQKDRAKGIFQEGIKIAAAKGDFMPANQMQSELDRL